ncbi:hypothetical protein F5148DRAFT_1369876 [Russula earlei]|uniref:Uncharacterized protein n=1 Tax=Russula earlei TaxID=71964 RepID=A0ACC0U1F9_9AGAM|nr:hypothetical protein F5148DRAFT_1369876 [Russula earlei]
MTTVKLGMQLFWGAYCARQAVVVGRTCLREAHSSLTQNARYYCTDGKIYAWDEDKKIRKCCKKWEHCGGREPKASQRCWWIGSVVPDESHKDRLDECNENSYPCMIIGRSSDPSRQIVAVAVAVAWWTVANCPHTPPRGQVPPVKPTKSSPVGKVYKYFLPENCEQYQKFGHDERFMLRPFDESGFLDFLKLKDQLPEIVLGKNLRKQESFLELANTAAQIIKDEYFSQGNTLEFRDMGNKSPPGHVMDTKCKPDIMAAFQNNWKDDVVRWPFIQLAGETASRGKPPNIQRGQVISYLHYLLLARPDLYIAQGLLSSEKGLTFFFGIGGEGIQEFHVQWDHERFDQLLYSSYINIEFDKETTAKILAYSKTSFAELEDVLNELKILQEHVHKLTQVPGVVVATYGETIPIGEPLSKERWKHRLGLGESGSPFTSIPTLSQVLETLFDVLEVLRYLQLHCEVLHRDISAGNVLYVKNSLDRSSLPKTVPLPQDLCFVKYLLGESNDPSKTSMLLVDFNLVEHLGPENGDKTQIDRTGTPIFIAQAVEQGAPVPPTKWVTQVPGIPQSRSPYAMAHPDRVKKFSSLIEEKIFVPVPTPTDKGSCDEFSHELNHDAESIFWLLLYWAMVVQPEKGGKEMIGTVPWSQLIGNHKTRNGLIQNIVFESSLLDNLIHSLYNPLQPLIKGLAAILVIDSHWLAATDPRKDLYYITKVFQRLILNFIIDNHGKEFMHCRVDKTFCKVQETHDSHALSVSNVQSLDAQSRVIPVGCDMDEIEID